MRNYDEIAESLSKDEQAVLKHHDLLTRLGCYVSDSSMEEAYDALIGTDFSRDASDVVTLWEPIQDEPLSVRDLLDLIGAFN